MSELNVFQKVRDGVILESAVLNDNISSRTIKNQNIGVLVNIGDCVYYNNTASRWLVSSNRVPQGVYIGKNVVLLFGKCSLFSGLLTGVFYYMRTDGSLTASIIESFNRTKIGFAMNDTTLFVDIDTVGVYS